MRGRRPHTIAIAPGDEPILRQIARSQSLPWYQVRRARTVLAIAAGERTRVVADWMQCDVVSHPERPGHPLGISPPAAGANRRTGLLGTGGQGPPHHSLVERRPGAPGRRRRNRPGHQPPDHPPDLARGRSATASHTVLADRPVGRPVQGAGREGPLVLRQRGAIGPAGHLDRLRRRDAQSPGPGATSDPAGDPRIDRAAGVRVHPAWYRQSPELPDRPQRADGGRVPGSQRCPALYRGVAAVPATASLAPRRVPDPRWRPQPYCRGDASLSRGMPRVVADPLDPGACLVAQSGRVAQPRVRLPLPEAWVVGQSRGVYCPCGILMAGIQPPLRASLRVDMDESKNATMVREARTLNFAYYLRPGTLGRVSGTALRRGPPASRAARRGVAAGHHRADPAGGKTRNPRPIVGVSRRSGPASWHWSK